MELDDLEALFEATRAEAERAVQPATPEPPVVVAKAVAEPAVTEVRREAAPVVDEAPAGEAPAVATCPNADENGQCLTCTCGNAKDLRDRVGRLTRELHESLQALSLDKALADVAVEIPDARNRLKYVTDMCERSAQKVLDTLDELAPLQQATRDDSAALLAKWNTMLDARQRPDEGFMALFEATRVHLAANIERADRSSSMHTDIMMAQDFQDLTGQVCRKIEAITEKIESQLLMLLIETAPKDHRARHQEMLEGPQVVVGRNDTVSSQSEVDDLLGSLGF